MPHISSTDLQNLIAQAVDEQWEELDRTRHGAVGTTEGKWTNTQLKRLIFGKYDRGSNSDEKR